MTSRLGDWLTRPWNSYRGPTPRRAWIATAVTVVMGVYALAVSRPWWAGIFLVLTVLNVGLGIGLTLHDRKQSQ